MIHPYATREYAEIAARPGERVFSVSEWHCHVLCRPVAGVADAAGCYPVTVFGRDADLEVGLERLQDRGLVSAVLVADPVLRPDAAALRCAFDHCRPFKTHYIFDRSQKGSDYSRHHRYELRRARAEVSRIALGDHLEDWIALYRELVVRHGINGPADYSDDAFRRLASLDGLVAFGAFAGKGLVACHLWVRSAGRVHSHLAASNAEGRASGAAYRLYDTAIRFFAEAETIDFGGGAGLADDPSDGLARFKRGFANRSAPAWLCGKILDQARYRSLCGGHADRRETDYFPAYRAPGTRIAEGAEA